MNFTSVVSKGNPKDRLDIPLISPVRSLIVPDGGRSAGSINKELQAINPTPRPENLTDSVCIPKYGRQGAPVTNVRNIFDYFEKRPSETLSENHPLFSLRCP